MKQLFRDRKQAGRLLATHLTKSLSSFDRKNSLILALPRGGVPVAVEVAHILDIPLDVLVVRKIGHPHHSEYGVGAITENGFSWTDKHALQLSQITDEQIQQVIEKEKKEVLRRVKKYRHNRPLSDLANKTVILIDDGLATGVTARVAAKYVRKLGAKKVLLAVPICPDESAQELPIELDEVICFQQSASLLAIGQFYEDFEQVSDEQVMDLLNSYKQKHRESFI